MKLQLITAVFILYYLSTLRACRETLSYEYRAIDRRRDRHSYWRCTAFSPMRHQFYRTIKSATITCSNVPSTLTLNYTYQTRFYDQDLVIADSKISLLPSNSSLASFSTIKKLTLKNLEIVDISPGAFNGLEVLHTLDLSDNKLTKTPEDVFDDLSLLAILDLSRNSINNVDRGSLYGLFSLRKLFLNGNNLTVLYDNSFKDLTSLETLDISDNPLEELQDVGFTNVMTFIARNTRLTRFNVDLSSLSMSKIDLSGGRLEDIDFAVFPSMEELDLSNNSLRKISNWDKLNCDEVFLKNNNLQILDLPHNVTSLDVSCNEIESISDKRFKRTYQLQSLNISHNVLKTLNLDMLPTENKVTEFYIDHNNIKWSDALTVLGHLENLKDVTLNENPWSCENFHDVVHWLKDRSVRVLDESSNNACKLAK